MSQRVLGITGASGLLGSAFLREQLERDRELRVIALQRNESAAFLAAWPPVLRSQVEVVAADVATLQPTARMLAAARRVTVAWWHFAAATTLAQNAAAVEETAAANEQGTERLLELVRQADPHVPFFHLSTAYVAGCRRGLVAERWLDEERYRNPYERSKARAEQAVARFFAAGGCGAVLRPSIVVSPGATGRPQLAELCRRALVQACERGEPEVVLRLPEDARLNLVSLPWVVRTCLAVGASDPRLRRIYHLTAEEDTRLVDLVRHLRGVTERPALRFAPAASPAELPLASRYLDLVLDEVRGYFDGEPQFDRTQLAALLPPAEHRAEPDLPDFIRAACQAAGSLESVSAP